ncbi:MAG: TRAM domain-containing protein, partial [Clostridia bacterium]|nr:TRAM domain-containing protein [Clostridia bacterium]
MEKTIKQNDIIQLEIIDYGINGEGVARTGGVVVFVPFAMKGETIKAKITFVKKDFATAELVEVVTGSPFRVKPVCNRFSRCGGCNLLHISYEEQIRMKKNILRTTLKKNTKADFEVED